MNPTGKRAPLLIPGRQERRITRALTQWCTSGEPAALRTRALIYLLWDGAVKTKGALSLDVQDVLDRTKEQVAAKKVVAQRPCEANRYRQRHFGMRARSRDALTAYLRAGLSAGWLRPAATSPLFVSTSGHRQGQRMSRRTAIHSFRQFQSRHLGQRAMYQLQDLVYSGRVAFLEASGDRVELLQEHAGLTDNQAWKYRGRMFTGGTAADVLEAMDLGCRLRPDPSTGLSVMEEDSACV